MHIAAGLSRANRIGSAGLSCGILKYDQLSRKKERTDSEIPSPATPDDRLAIMLLGSTSLTVDHKSWEKARGGICLPRPLPVKAVIFEGRGGKNDLANKGFFGKAFGGNYRKGPKGLVSEPYLVFFFWMRGIKRRQKVFRDKAL